MTDQHEPLFYSYSLFPSGTAEVFPGQSLQNYTNYLPAAESCKQQLATHCWDMTVREPSHQPFCPRCTAVVSENTNWCSSCGNLLIGANLCASEFADWNSRGQSLCSAQVSRNVSSATEWYFTSASQQPSAARASYIYQETHPHFRDCADYSQLATSAVTLNPIADATSLAMASSFSPQLFNTSAIQSEEFLVPVTQQSNPTYHVSETSVPYGSSQVESVRSCFGDLHLTNRSPNSIGSLHYVANGSQDQQALTGTLLRTASSYPDSAKDGAYLSPQMDRQRCISDPIWGCVMAAERGYFSGARQLDSFPSIHHLYNRTSPLAPFYGSQVQQQSADVLDSCVKSSECSARVSRTFSSGSGTQFPADIKNVHCPSIRSNRSRRKHPSECFGLPCCSSYIGTNDTSTSGFGSRLRCFSSDFRASNRQDSHIENGSTQCNWWSSRSAWTAHSPALLKKKSAAYLHAFYSRELQNLKLQSHAEVSDIGIHNTPSDNSRPMPLSYSDEQLQLSSSCKQDVHSATPNTQSDRSVYRRGQTEKYKKKPRKRLSKRLFSDPATCAVTCPVSSNTDSDSIMYARDPSFGAVIHVDKPKFTVAASLSIDHWPDWMRLPSELWISITRFLPPCDRAHLARACRRLSNLVMDPSLWRVVQLHRHQHLTDSALVSIGRLQPRDLRFSYCHGSGIAEEGLRNLFKSCGPSLRKLSFVGCTKGPFDGDLTLLLAAEHCPNLNHVDASYTLAVRDHTVTALARSTQHLISVKLNGAQQISNSAIQQLVHYHKETLQRLELFGCFRLNSDIFALLSRCQQLRALAFGHLHHLSSDGLLELVGKLPLLASLDLRGTQTLANDTNLSHLADKCPHLEEVVLANMLSVKHEAGVAQMLRRLPRLRVLDLCGLMAVGDLTMEALSVGCPQLEELDVSCTSVTHTGLFHLTRAPAKCLRCLRISHCREITKDVLEKLVEACTNLTLIHAYGFKTIKDWSFLQKIRPTLHVECDG